MCVSKMSDFMFIENCHVVSMCQDTCLHTLVALSPCSFQASNSSEETECHILPITSYECKWKKTSKRKESNLKISEGTFEKHTMVVGDNTVLKTFLNLTLVQFSFVALLMNYWKHFSEK